MQLLAGLSLVMPILITPFHEPLVPAYASLIGTDRISLIRSVSEKAAKLQVP